VPRLTRTKQIQIGPVKDQEFWHAAIISLYAGDARNGGLEDPFLADHVKSLRHDR
jgi:hypothetical protein